MLPIGQSRPSFEVTFPVCTSLLLLPCLLRSRRQSVVLETCLFLFLSLSISFPHAASSASFGRSALPPLLCRTERDQMERKREKEYSHTCARSDGRRWRSNSVHTARQAVDPCELLEFWRGLLTLSQDFFINIFLLGSWRLILINLPWVCVNNR